MYQPLLEYHSSLEDDISYDYIAIGKIIAVIVGGMFVILPIFCGFLAIKSYFDNGKRIRQGLAKYGKENLLKNRYGAISSIDFELLDGSGWFLCSGIEDHQIQEYMQLCYQHNSKIMFGYTKENLERHKERVAKYKNKEIVIPELVL